MSEDLREGISRLFSWRWPSCAGVIVSVDTQAGPVSRYGGGLVLVIGYEFSTNHANYSGEYFWEPGSPATVLAAGDQFKIGQKVSVRFRPDDPDVSTLDRQMFDDFMTVL